MWCPTLQGSILGPLLFLIYVNDLFKSSEILNPIMFADDTNLFFSNKNITTLFKTVNEELTHVNKWFKVNKLSLNSSKTKYTFFHKPNISDDIPLKLPMLYKVVALEKTYFLFEKYCSFFKLRFYFVTIVVIKTQKNENLENLPRLPKFRVKSVQKLHKFHDVFIQLRISF